MQHTNSNPKLATTRPRQPDPIDRRQQGGSKRLTIWLSPQEADTLHTLGDEWPARTLKALLAGVTGGTERFHRPQTQTVGDLGTPLTAVLREGNLAAAVLAERAKTIALLFRLGLTARDIAALLHLEQSEVARVLIPAPECFTLTGEPITPDAAHDQADLMHEVDTLLAQGLSGSDIAQQFNAAGRRPASGVEYRGANLIRDWRRWKATTI